ncbi:MAG: 4-hydroxy-tetrahydrodipicolinate synthase [Leptolyngbyaceae bacterium]|nr:4-hydroxy-tetrahydrodipicolinate synthase [Leptolyngbyaceae bacterium]
MTSFGRVLTAMITPFDDEGHVDYGVAEKLANHLVDQGTDTLVLCGTTGESPTLTWDEEYKLFQVIQTSLQGRAKIIAGTGSNSTREAIEATRIVGELGLDGSLQVVPYYNKPTQQGLYSHFEAIAQACPDVSILLYNVPTRTGCNLQPETVAQLARIDNVIGVKEASGKLDQVSKIRRMAPEDFAVYSGDDGLTLPMLALGATGVVSVASHIAGKQIQSMIRSYESGDVRTATRLHLELTPLFEVLFIETNPTPVKAALRLQGWPVGQTRLPLAPLSSTAEGTLRTVLTDLNFLSNA